MIQSVTHILFLSVLALSSGANASVDSMTRLEQILSKEVQSLQAEDSARTSRFVNMLSIYYGAKNDYDLFDKILLQRETVLAKRKTAEIEEMLEASSGDAPSSFHVRIVDFKSPGRLVVQFEKYICFKNYRLDVTLDAVGNGFVYSKANTDVVKSHSRSCMY